MQRRGCQPFTSGHSYNACQCVLPALPPQTCCTSATDTVHLSRTFVQEGQLIVQKGQFTKGRGLKDYLQKHFRLQIRMKCVPLRVGGCADWAGSKTVYTGYCPGIRREPPLPTLIGLWFSTSSHRVWCISHKSKRHKRTKGCPGATHEVRSLRKLTLVPCPRKQ